jgi:hypothetical protein
MLRTKESFKGHVGFGGPNNTGDISHFQDMHFVEHGEGVDLSPVKSRAKSVATFFDQESAAPAGHRSLYLSSVLSG